MKDNESKKRTSPMYVKVQDAHCRKTKKFLCSLKKSKDTLTPIDGVGMRDTSLEKM